MVSVPCLFFFGPCMLSLHMLNLDRFQFLVIMLVSQLLGRKPVRLTLISTGRDLLLLVVGLLNSPHVAGPLLGIFPPATYPLEIVTCIVSPSLEIRKLTPPEPATLFKLNPVRSRTLTNLNWAHNTMWFHFPQSGISCNEARSSPQI